MKDTFDLAMLEPRQNEELTTGERIHLLMRREGLRAAEVGLAIGAGETTVWRWEHGHTEPGSGKIRELAKLLKTSADFLVGLTDDPSPNGQSKGGSLSRHFLSRFKRNRRFASVPAA